MTDPKRFLFPALAVLCGLVAAIILGETLVRLVSPPFVMVAPAIKEPDTEIGYRLIPHVRARGRMPGEYDVAYVINELGLRERPGPAEPDARQILFLGDSFTFGTGVEAAESFPRILEDLLNTAPRRTGRVRTVNMGVYGYSSAQSLALLRRVGDRFSPDLVVYVVVGAYDFPRNTAGIEPFTLGGLPSWLRNGLSHSHLVQFLFRARTRIGQERQWKTPAILSKEAPTTFSRGAEVTAGSLAGMQEWAAGRGAGFVVVYMPLCYELNRGEWESRGVGDFFDAGLIGDDPTVPERMVLDITGSRGMPLIDLLPELRAAGRDHLYYPLDRHLTPVGHRLVAEILAPRIAAMIEPEDRRGDPRSSR